MLITTLCPFKIYQDYLSKSFERKIQQFYSKSFFEDMREVFNKGIPEGRIHSMTGSPTMSKSSLYDLQWLYDRTPVSEECLNILRKRAFKVTYKGQLLTSETVVLL